MWRTRLQRAPFPQHATGQCTGSRREKTLHPRSCKFAPSPRLLRLRNERYRPLGRWISSGDRI